MMVPGHGGALHCSLSKRQQVWGGRKASFLNLLCQAMVSGPGSVLPESLPALLVCRGLSSHLHSQAPSQGQGSIPTGVWGGRDTEVLVPAILPTGCGLLGISLLHSRPRVPHLYKGWLIFEEPFQPLCVNAHVSVLPHAQNRFKGRKCLSWNVYHKVNSSLSQGCQNNFHPGCC